MGNIKIFRVAHGEGKTRLLFNRAIEESDNGKRLLYVGDAETMSGIVRMWEEYFRHKCPILNINEINGHFTKEDCFLTDGLFENLLLVGGYYNIIVKELNAPWYITMDKEDFEN